MSNAPAVLALPTLALGALEAPQFPDLGTSEENLISASMTDGDPSLAMLISRGIRDETGQLPSADRSPDLSAKGLGKGWMKTASRSH